MGNPVEEWKASKHPLDVWGDVLNYAASRTEMKDIASDDLERMKWHGVFYRKRDTPASYMLRLRATSGELTSEQARAAAFVAYEMGYGIVDVTTRANLQIQGLNIKDVPTALQRLSDVGLSTKQTGHDNIRNVFGHAMSGLDPEELIDTRSLCDEVTEIFVDSRVYSDLPRKFNIALNGSSSSAPHYWSQDVSYMAHRLENGRVVFHALVGGTQGQNPHLPWLLPVFVEPEQVVEVTRTLLNLFREHGSREKRNKARFRFLIERIGLDGVMDFLLENLDFEFEPIDCEPTPPSGYEELIGWIPQRQPGQWAMGVAVPLGRLTWEQLEGVALASAQWGDGSIRLTCEQGLIIPNIPTARRSAIATDLARHGLSIHADTLDRNLVACTGKQFCNIAVAETKGNASQLMHTLRARGVKLEGIRVHMSGCPSSCAQHFTADIGLKGVRVRRLLGTKDGFDVFLGGGVNGHVELGQPYKLGVDVEQLPLLIEEVVNDYYLRHKPGETFSSYWRDKLASAKADKASDEDFAPPVWVCDCCDYRRQGEDPPIYCPHCSSLRRHFARLEDVENQSDDAPSPVVRADGFVDVAADSALQPQQGLGVQVAGREVALFRNGDQIHAIDGLCPHEGATLAEGDFDGKTVTCPWHGWQFDSCSGCSIDPKGHDLKLFDAKIEDGRILVKAPAGAETTAAPKRPNAIEMDLTVSRLVDETPDIKTISLDNGRGQFPEFLPGQFLRVRVPAPDGDQVWRSFTISSCPTDLSTIELTVKRNPEGVVSNYLHDQLDVGRTLHVKGPQGGFYFDGKQHPEPLVLLAAGSGVTPMMSILRYVRATQPHQPCTLLFGCRHLADIIFRQELERLQARWDAFHYHVTLSAPPPNWDGHSGRLHVDLVKIRVPDVAGARYFLCGPGDFIGSMRSSLGECGVPADRIHSEQFHSGSVKSAKVGPDA